MKLGHQCDTFLCPGTFSGQRWLVTHFKLGISVRKLHPSEGGRERDRERNLRRRIFCGLLVRFVMASWRPSGGGKFLRRLTYEAFIKSSRKEHAVVGTSEEIMVGDPRDWRPFTTTPIEVVSRLIQQHHQENAFILLFIKLALQLHGSYSANWTNDIMPTYFNRLLHPFRPRYFEGKRWPMTYCADLWYRKDAYKHCTRRIVLPLQ